MDQKNTNTQCAKHDGLNTQHLMVNGYVDNLRLSTFFKQLETNFKFLQDAINQFCLAKSTFSSSLNETTDLGNESYDYPRYASFFKTLQTNIDFLHKENTYWINIVNDNNFQQLISYPGRNDDKNGSLLESNLILKEKVKFCQQKLSKFANQVKSLKEDKNAILKIFKSYTDQVYVWKTELSKIERQWTAHAISAPLEVNKCLSKIKCMPHVTMDHKESYEDTKPIISHMDSVACSRLNEGNFLEIKNKNLKLMDITSQLTNILNSRQLVLLKNEPQQYSQNEECNDEILSQSALLFQDEPIKILIQQIFYLVGNDEYVDKLSSESFNLDQKVKPQLLEGTNEKLANDKLSKLRYFAIKQKQKIKELLETVAQLEHNKDKGNKQYTEKIQTLENNLKYINQKLKCSEETCDMYAKKLNLTAEDILKDKELLLTNDEIIAKLSNEVKELKESKELTENWKKEISIKVKTLRTERKGFENKIANLTTELETRNDELLLEKQKHNQVKLQLDQYTNERKKLSLLTMEIQDYERSVQELLQNLDIKQGIIDKLKTEIETQQKLTISIQKEREILESRLSLKQDENSKIAIELNNTKQKYDYLDQTVEQKDEKIQTLSQLLETARLENEKLSLETSKLLSDDQMNYNILEVELSNLRKLFLSTQQNLRETQELLSLREEEIKSIQHKYEEYKVRAQSVYRQNMSRDVSKDEKIQEELVSSKALNDKLRKTIVEIREEYSILSKSNKSLTQINMDKIKNEYYLQNCIKELQDQTKDLNKKYQTLLCEHEGTIQTIKEQTDTLTQTFKQQLMDQRKRYSEEIFEIQSKLDKTPSFADCNTDIAALPREEGEGSENMDYNNSFTLSHLLEVDTNVIPEVEQTKQLEKTDLNLLYITALLADTEQDLAKHIQMNKVLKDEIRRQQRSLEREKHADNLEYLKNVLIKFLTSSNTDERSHLVPVLNTILKLSPEEYEKISEIAKCDSKLRGWSNFLSWSNSS